MPASCYRCIDQKRDEPGEPFGACDDCSALACINCGVRVPVICLFQCVMCYPSNVLLSSSRLGGGPTGGGPGDCGDGVPTGE
jgi:hypothetical protein